MIAQSPAAPIASATTVTIPAAARSEGRGLLDALAAFIQRAAETPATSTDSERYWTSVARGL